MPEVHSIADARMGFATVAKIPILQRCRSQIRNRRFNRDFCDKAVSAFDPFLTYGVGMSDRQFRTFRKLP
jgi:hypothetical protein